MGRSLPGGPPAAASSTIPRVIRLRQSIEAGLRHPLLGPLLLLALAIVLVFVVFHTVEHGVAGLLFSCAILAAASLRLVVVLGRTWRATTEPRPLVSRGPPSRSLYVVPARGVPTGPSVLPLRL